MVRGTPLFPNQVYILTGLGLLNDAIMLVDTKGIIGDILISVKVAHPRIINARN